MFAQEHVDPVTAGSVFRSDKHGLAENVVQGRGIEKQRTFIVPREVLNSRGARSHRFGIGFDVDGLRRRPYSEDQRRA